MKSKLKVDRKKIGKLDTDRWTHRKETKNKSSLDKQVAKLWTIMVMIKRERESDCFEKSYYFHKVWDFISLKAKGKWCYWTVI